MHDIIFHILNNPLLDHFASILFVLICEPLILCCLLLLYVYAQCYLCYKSII